MVFQSLGDPVGDAILERTLGVRAGFIASETAELKRKADNVELALYVSTGATIVTALMVLLGRSRT